MRYSIDTLDRPNERALEHEISATNDEDAKTEFAHMASLPEWARHQLILWKTDDEDRRILLNIIRREIIEKQM